MSSTNQSPPAKCRICKRVFWFGGATFSNSSGITFKGGSCTCPFCGGTADIGSGTFSNAGDALKVERAEPATHAMIASLQALVRKAKVGEVSQNDIVDELQKISPQLAEAVTKKPLSLVFLITAIMLFLKACSLNATVDFNVLIDQAWHIAHHEDPMDHSGPVVEVPDETPPAEHAAPNRDGHKAEGAASKPSRQVRRQEERRTKKLEQAAARLHIARYKLPKSPR